MSTSNFQWRHDGLAEVLRAHPEYLGERHKGENALPILIKFIDAKKDLSVQVHPTDVYAQEHENGQLGKTEMWYVLDAGREARLDYAPGLDGLPKSDVLKFLLEDNCSIVVRPSGTEPKLKTYISVSAEYKEAAEAVEAEICKSAEEFLK